MTIKKTISICLVFTTIAFNSFCQTKLLPNTTDPDGILSGERKALKSISSSQNLDSVVTSVYQVENEDWLNYRKSEFIFENNGKTKTEYQYTWDSENFKWSNWKHNICKYNDVGNKIEEIKGLWNQGSLTWEQTSKEVWAYNSTGLLTFYAKFLWNTSLKIWEGEKREQYTYDEQGNILEHIYSEWNSVDNDFRNLYQQTNEYLVGDLMKYIFSYWNNTNQSWEVYSFVEYHYNNGLKVLASGFLISNADTLYMSKMDWIYGEDHHPMLFRYYNFDNTDSTWYVIDQQEYLYDNYGNQSMIKRYTLNSTIDSLLIHQKELYSYNEKGNKTNEFYTDYEYTLIGDKIVGLDSAGYEYSFSYNSADLLLIELYHDWYPWSDPNETFKYEYEYDDNNNLVCQSYYKSSSSTEWQGLEKYIADYINVSEIKQYAYYYWDDEVSDWVLNNQSVRGIYYYHENQTSINPQNDLPKIIVSLYPNPVNDNLTIETNNDLALFTLKLYDIYGKLVVKEMFTDDLHVNIAHLNMGIYTCVIESGEKSYISKVIKK